MARGNPARRRFTALLLAGLGLVASVAWARCPAPCRVSAGAAHRRCRVACPRRAAGKACRAACGAERRTENATCRAAQSPTAPSCGLTDLYVATLTDGASTTDAARMRRRGSVSDPFVRITDAVARARAERAFGVLPAEDEIRIHVAPGTYVGSFDAAALQQHAEYEVLPIILNVPRLALLGATVLVRDDRNLPTGTEPGTETILEPDTPLTATRHLLLVTRTADGGVGDGVTVDGFTLDGRGGTFFPCAAVFLDRVTGFLVSNSLIQHACAGVLTRLASGTIEGNLLADNAELGTLLTGGSLAHPAMVLIHANRSTRHGHGFGHSIGGYVSMRTDPGRNTVLLLEPLQTTFDRNNPVDVQNIPDTLTVTLSGNDSSDNGQTGIRFGGIYQGLDYQTANATQPVTSVLTANVVGNTCARNGYYGVIIEAAQTFRRPGRFIQTLAGTFEGNSFVGNARAAALFTFVYWRVSVGGLGTTLADDKFVEDSTYQVTDAEGELAGFDYDNPVTDPISGTVLNNTLLVNGVEIPHGTSITP